jgi:hypothetical protein
MEKSEKWLIAILAIFLVLSIAWYFGVFSYLKTIPPEEKIAPTLKDETGRVEVYITLSVPLNPILRYKLEQYGLDIRYVGEFTNILTGYIDAENIYELAKLPEVLAIDDFGDEPVIYGYGATLEQIKEHINAENLDVTGDGVTVVMVDADIDCSVPELQGKCIEQWDCDQPPGCEDNPNVDCHCEQLPDDDKHPVFPDHGTGVAKIITSIAPDVKIIAIADACYPDSRWVIGTTKAIDRIRNIAGPKIFHMSCGAPLRENSPINVNVNEIMNMGVPAVIAKKAGFDGNICCPACLKNAIAVGSVDINNRISGFSSRGPVVFNDETYIKPDIVAVGETELGYGTSFSAPEVTGVVALMLEKNPFLSGIDVKKIIMSTARELPENAIVMCNSLPLEKRYECECYDNTYGMGLIQANLAVKRAEAVTFLSSILNMFRGVR